MTLPYDLRRHYQCAFDLKPNGNANEIWPAVVGTVREWVRQALHRQTANWSTGPITIARIWNGGEWRYPRHPRVSVTVDQEAGNGSKDRPQFWSLRLKHPCADHPFRSWQTDVGVVAGPNGACRVSSKTAYFFSTTFIGEEPPSPVPAAPVLIRQLLSATRYNGWAGATRLRAEPTPVLVGHGDRFVHEMKEKGRACPLVYISRRRLDNETIVNPGLLSRALAGLATVMVAASKTVDEELEYLLPTKLYCGNGVLRIYLPGVDFNADGESARHRFFVLEHPDEQSSQQVFDVITRSLVRGALTYQRNEVTSLEDVVARRNEIRLAELRQGGSGEEIEMLDLFAANIERLEAEKRQVQKELDAFLSEYDGLENELNNWKSSAKKLEDDLRQSEFIRKEFEERLASIKANAKPTAGRKMAADEFATLPEDLADVVRRIASLHEGKIAFTDRAFKTSSGPGMKQFRTQIKDIWKLFVEMATTLRDLFRRKGGQVERGFQDKTGFELALTEGKNTKHDRDLVKLRKDWFDGQPIDVNPHVKCREFRVYFAFDHQREIIIVSHLGHLDTAGTRRMT
ncbi:MAG: hypothetical protein HYY84_16230 [Deltaproteobacteria bacterium]|nr:hypothetical protein [Deltaproteobacteria bacterium]